MENDKEFQTKHRILGIVLRQEVPDEDAVNLLMTELFNLYVEKHKEDYIHEVYDLFVRRHLMPESEEF